MKVTTDIDIDFANRDKALQNLNYISASMSQNGNHVKHPTGVYFQDIPVDPLTGYASLNYKDAENLGYFKIDFLNNSIYAGVQSEEHLEKLMAEPDWDLFESEHIVGMLAHIHSSFGIVKSIEPRCVEDLAVILALMRPGKKHLMGKSRQEIDDEIWLPVNDGYQFRRSHAIAYAVSIVVQLNLLIEQTAQKIDNVSEEFFKI
jgi:hypothetical protein